MSRSLRAGSTRALIGAVAALAVVVAACSTSQWDTSEANNPVEVVKTYTRDTNGVRESLIDHLSTVGDNLNEWAAPRDQATCAADRILDALEADRLLELGYEPDTGKLALPYTPDEQTAMLNILASCIDFKSGLLELLSAYQKISYTSAQCVADGIDEMGLTRLYVASLLIGAAPDPFETSNNLAQGTTKVMGDCIPITELSPATPQQIFPQDYDATTTTQKPKPAPSSTTTTLFGSSGLSSGAGATTTEP